MSQVANQEEYTDFDEPQEKPDAAFAPLNRLVDKARKLQNELGQLEALLKSKNEELQLTMTKEIPSMMKDMGVKDFTTSKGVKVSYANEVRSHISRDNQNDAFKWLEDNGHGGIIKREITITFDKEQYDIAAKLQQELIGKGFGSVQMARKVHPSTLKAWVKEVTKRGDAIPTETFGIFEQDMASFQETDNKR